MWARGESRAENATAHAEPGTFEGAPPRLPSASRPLPVEHAVPQPLWGRPARPLTPGPCLLTPAPTHPIIRKWQTTDPHSSAALSKKISPPPSVEKASTSGTPATKDIWTSPDPPLSTSSATASRKPPPPWPSRPQNSNSSTPASSPLQSPKPTRKHFSPSPENTSSAETSPSPAAGSDSAH